MSAIAKAADFHLATVEFSLADNANALVIERSPSSDSIFCTEDREPIIKFEVRVHNAKVSLLTARKRTIGTADGRRVRQNPRSRLMSNLSVLLYHRVLNWNVAIRLASGGSVGPTGPPRVRSAGIEGLENSRPPQTKS